MSTPRDRLDAIRARAEAATPGRWEMVPTVGNVVIAADRFRDGYWTNVADRIETEADAGFIAASRSDVPDLVAFARAVLDLAKEHRAIESKDPWAEAPAGIVAYAIERLADEHLGTKESD